MPNDRWPTIAVLGAGAVGCYFGGMLARAGAPVTLVGRAAHVEAISRQGLFLERHDFQGFISVRAVTDLAEAGGAELVLFCVKTLDTEEAAQLLRPHLAAESLVISLQNGVDNVERIRSATGIEAFPAVVYVAAQMTAPGCVKHNGRGDLIVGSLSKSLQAGELARIEKVAGLFARAGIPCMVSSNIEGELWLKLMMNCAYNAISALSRAQYGRILENPQTRQVMLQAVAETVAVAQAAGVQLPPSNPAEAALKLGEAMRGALSSTAQDIARGRRTEIDSLNGYVARRGAEIGVPTPVNQTLHALIKLLEESAESA